jgi:hypothetical protein
VSRIGLLGVSVAATVIGCHAAAGQDTVVVQSDRDPVWGLPTRLVEELRIGAVDGNEHETFGRLIGAAVGPAGEFVTVDQQGPALQLFDSAGKYVRDIGRPGQGPGEYRSVAGVRFTSGDEIAIWDPSNRRITTYTLEGGVTGTIRVNASVQGGEEPFQVDTAGCFYVKAVGALVGHVISQYIWIKVDRDGNELDSVPIPKADGVGRPLVVRSLGGSLTPFRVETVSALSPYGYEVTGRTDVYAISRPLPDGKVLRIQHTARAVSVGEEERAQWKAVLDYMESVSPSTATRFEPIPSQKPSFKALWVDDSGRIWVHRYVSAVHVPPSPIRQPKRQGLPVLKWLEPPVWDTYDERGMILGSITLPLTAVLVASRGSRVWVIEHGALDESYLVRYRIEARGAEDAPL